MRVLRICLWGGLAFLLYLAPRLHAATTVVQTSGFSFVPANTTVQVGDTVTWTNAASLHTSTSGTNPPAGNGLWDSGTLTAGGTFSHTFTQPGSFPYFCSFHYSFGMVGSVTVQGGGGNAPPTVSITSPTNGSSYISPAVVTISADAADSDGTVAQVQFFDGTNSVGTTASSPYSAATTLYPGAHALTAVATDNLGAMATSAVVTVTVNTVRIADPVSNHIAKGDITIELKTVLDGLASPLGFAMPDDGSGRMFVYDQTGQAWVVTPSGPLATPFMDLRNRIVPGTTYDERGFLCIATHPNFAQHPLIYTFTSEPVSGPADFTDSNPPNGSNNCQTVIAEWRIDPANTNQVDSASRRELLRIDKPYENHNGGTLMFGPDGYLYISTGDGGGANDTGPGHLFPEGNAQNLQVIYGKMLRIDVNGTNSANGQYGIPADNPFVGQNAVQEIYAYGLRNPFKFSFDPQTGDLYCQDAGQNTVEEVSRIVKGGNYGWNAKEGSFWFDSVPSDTNFGSVVTGPVKPAAANLIDPILEYDHFDGNVVIGGFVYRGTQIPQLQGRYVFGDWGSFTAPTARLFYLDTNNVIKEFHIGLDDRPTGVWLKGFGQDASGEIYVFGTRVLGPAGNTGVMLKIVPPSPALEVAGSQAAGGSNFTLSWTGGRGPFAVQQKSTLADETWMDTLFTTNTQANLPLAGGAAFFRVADTAHQPATPFTASLSGAAERPNPVTTTGTGFGMFILDGNTLRFSINYSGLSGAAVAAHIHGPAGVNDSASPILSLEPYAAGPLGTSGAFSGTVVISDTFKAMILAGQTYMNVHTPNNPGGEIRGQLAPVLMQASLNGTHEVPPVPGNGHALGEFALVGNELYYNITYRDLSGTAVAAHIHGPAPIGSNATVLVPFSGGGFGTNGAISGAVQLTPDQLGDVVAGLTYVNIHTPLNGGGEIRGQLVPQAVGVPLSVALSADAEKPNSTTSSGSGFGLLSLEGETLRFSIGFSNLNSAATAAHIHGPGTSQQSAPVVISLVPFNGGSFGTSGQLSGSVAVTPAQRDMLLSGLGYANVHTTNYPGGEIRGQIGTVLLQASLSGVNELPSIVSDGSGYGAFALVANQLTFDVTYSGLSSAASAASINGPGSLFATRPPLIDLGSFNGGSFGTFGALAGTTSLSVTNLGSVIDGQTYVNISTSTNTTGEIRGQIVR